MYFVTLCTKHRAWLLGAIKRGVVHLSDVGEIVATTWSEIGDHFPGVYLDAWVVMPNHVHGLIRLTRPHAPSVSLAPFTCRARLKASRPVHRQRSLPAGPAPRSLGAIVGSFKSASTKRVNRLRGTPRTSLWQRDYYEHIVRNEWALGRIRRYIARNPAQWSSRYGV